MHVERLRHRRRPPLEEFLDGATAKQVEIASASHVSPWIGFSLVVLGAIAALVSSSQHRRFCRSLGPGDVPIGYRPGAGLAIGYGVAVAGLLLAAVLVM